MKGPAEGLTEAMRAAIDESELATRRDLREMELGSVRISVCEAVWMLAEV